MVSEVWAQRQDETVAGMPADLGADPVGVPAGGTEPIGAAIGAPPVDLLVGGTDRAGGASREPVDGASIPVARSGAWSTPGPESGRVASAVVERLRNNAELAVERGITRIGDDVVEKIAGIAARGVPGVYDLGGDVARIFAAVKERIGLGDPDDGADRGISVRLEGRVAVVDVTLVVEYGFVVHAVTEKVRAKVIDAVENMLGLAVREVNILVDDVHVPESGPVGDDEARAAGYPA